MVKKIVSLSIIVSLSVSMLTGCAFLIPLVQMGMDGMNNDKNYESDEKEQGENKSSKDVGIDEGTEADTGKESRSEQEETGTDGLASINELLTKIYETEYQPSTFKQEDAESETVQWICATYALYNQANGKDVTRISGFEDLSLANQEIIDALQEKMKIHIWEAWGVDNRKTFVESLQKLLYKERPLDEAKELKGWDLSRANQMVGDAYYVNFINLEECLDLSLLISQDIQIMYNSWDELSESHLDGLQRLKEDNPRDPESESGKRLAAYKELEKEASEGKGPYAIPFDAELVKTWDTKTMTDKKAEEAKNEKEEEDIREGTIKEDAEGYITLLGYQEGGPQIKLKIPEGFVESEFSDATRIVLENPQWSTGVITWYQQEWNDIAAIKDWMEEDKKFYLSLYPDSLKIIDEKYEENGDEVTWYFATETKEPYEKGVNVIDYQGYKAKKIGDEWLGVMASFSYESIDNVDSQDAVKWLFSEAKFSW